MSWANAPCSPRQSSRDIVKETLQDNRRLYCLKEYQKRNSAGLSFTQIWAWFLNAF